MPGPYSLDPRECVVQSAESRLYRNQVAVRFDAAMGHREQAR